MKGLNLGFQQGLPVAIDELNQLQERDKEIVTALHSSYAAKYGNGFIALNGLEHTLWTIEFKMGVSAGWCLWNGELLELRADAKFLVPTDFADLVFSVEKVDTVDVIWGDGVVRETHYRNVLKVSVNTGSLNAGEIRCSDIAFFYKRNIVTGLLSVNMNVPTIGKEPLMVVEGESRQLHGTLSFAGSTSFVGSVLVMELAVEDRPKDVYRFPLTYYRPGLTNIWQGMLTIDTNGDVILHPERSGSLSSSDVFSLNHVNWTV